MLSASIDNIPKLTSPLLKQILKKRKKKKKVRYGKKEFSILILDIWTYPPMTP